jgi:hypothetical protein
MIFSIGELRLMVISAAQATKACYEALILQQRMYDGAQKLGKQVH